MGEQMLLSFRLSAGQRQVRLLWRLEAGEAIPSTCNTARLTAVLQRYDNVVAKIAQPDRETLVHVAGVSFAMTQLARSMAEEQEASVKALAAATQGAEKSFGRYPTRRCDVYVVSFGQGLLRSRLALCALLWKNNIKADLVSSLCLHFVNL